MESSKMEFDQQDMVTMGRVGKLYGIKGWLKLISFTDPQDNILDFRTLFAKLGGRWQEIEMDQSKVHGKGLVAHFVGYDDPDEARLLTGVELAVRSVDLPALDPEDFYWHELSGMQVKTVSGQLLGTVETILATGANDVLVVRPSEGSIDTRERLIPYLPDRVVVEISRTQRCISVDWDPDYLA